MKTSPLISVLILLLTGQVFGQNAADSSFRTWTQEFIDTYLGTYSISSENLDITGYQRALDERTDHTWKRKCTLKSKRPFTNDNKQKVYQRVYLAFYEYADSNTAAAAFDTLSKCFGMLCWPLKKGENIKYLKTFPALYIFNSTNVISCHVPCEKTFDSWETIKSHLLAKFSDKNSIVLTTECGGPLTWIGLGN